MEVFSVPTNGAPPLSFVANLDGHDYECIVYSPYVGARPYLLVKTIEGNVVINTALQSGLDGASEVNLLQNYFANASMYYYPSSQTLVLNT